MANEGRDSDLLLIALMLVALRDDDDPFLNERLYSLLRRRLRRADVLDPETDELLMHALRFGRRPRPRRFEEAREAATAVFEGFRRTFEASIDAKVETLDRRLAEVAGGQGTIQTALAHQRDDIRLVRDEFHSFLWMFSSGADVARARFVRYVPVRIYVTDPVPDQRVLRSLGSAIEQLADEIGFDKADEFPEESGSWWKRLILRTREAANHEEVAQRLTKAERALEVAYLDKPQSEANKNQAEAASALIKALAKTSHACLQLGSLLVVKATRGDGESCVVARTLTPSELKRLEENQAMLRRPDEILEWLAGGEVEDLSGPAKRLTSA